MNPTKGYYCLIQYCPDLGRMEAANIGVLLFCPERAFLKAKTTRSNQRIIKFFGSKGHDWRQVNLFKKGIIDRLANESSNIRSIDDLRQFIASRANLIQITPPRPMKVHDPDRDLEALAREFELDVSKRVSERSLGRVVRERLLQAGLANKLKTDIQLAVPVFKKYVEVPLGYQNGAFNLLNPVPFLAQETEQSITKACRFAVEGKSLNATLDPELGRLQFCVIGQFRQGDVDTRTVVSNVLHDHGVKLYRFDQLPTLIDEIRRNGKEIA